MKRRLESLDLQGFKTFATQSRLEFPGQITAIVGPNGSGKSNIADSIRWVLGEQSYSLLRARRTEDMIFSGSQQRPRAGMASVTITFNNDDGWLPIDYAEVAVTRRAYRDGQNEYLLNGQKVRLKDISELLSQTGLAERTYTIIGQGLVDVVLALKPDERRELFEEAAGIGLYRSRKEEALRRLETTRKNLARVLDIMTEIKPRLRSLERQANRFSDYRQLRADLEMLLREWYGYHWHQKQADVRYIRQALEDQEQRLKNFRIKYEDVQAQVEESRSALQENRKSLEKAHNELGEHHEVLESATRELAILDERRRSYYQQKSHLEIDLANAQEELKELAARDEYLQREIDQRAEDFNAAVEQRQRIEAKLSEIHQIKETKEKALNALRDERIKLETEKIQRTAHLEELRNRLTAADQEKDEIAAALADLRQQKEQINKNLKSLETKKIDAEKKFAIIRAKHVENVKETQRIKEKQAQVSEVLAQFGAKRAKLKAQLDVLWEAEQALSGYSEGTKSLVEDSRKGKLPRGIEPLSRFIVVDEKYERAISVALGELADLLVLPSNEQDIVIEYLSSKPETRVALITLQDPVPMENTDRFTSVEGFICFANDLIHVEPRYQQLINQLFGDILLAADKKAARLIQSKLKGSQRVVTIDGILFQANGVMITGQSPAGRRISRTRRQNEMQSDLAELDLQITRYQEEQVEYGQVLSELDTARIDFEEKLESAKENLTQIQDEQQNLLDTLNRVRENITWHNSRTEVMENSLAETRALIESDLERISVLNTKITELEGQEKQALQQIRELPLFEVQDQLSHWQTQTAVMKNALETAKNRSLEHQSRMQTVKTRLGRYEERLQELDQSLTEIREKEQALKTQVEELNKIVESIKNQKIEPLTQEGAEIEQKYTALQKMEDHTHEQIILAERQYTQLQLETSRRRDQLSNLQERIEDDFGLVTFEFDQKMDGPEPLPFDDGSIKDLPNISEIPENLEPEIKRLKAQIRRIGAINPEAQQEYDDVKDRYEFLNNQIDDLEKASENLKTVIEELDSLMERDFIKTFKAVNQEFSEYFARLFNGGEAELIFSDETDPVEGGVDIIARLPGRRQQGLALLSGGERSLTAVALVFALLKVSPTPFCVLDEVDAMLDESNVGRFADLLQELAKKTQFILITHNRNTVQVADVIYGVTMARDSTSQMISLKLEDVDETYVE